MSIKCLNLSLSTKTNPYTLFLAMNGKTFPVFEGSFQASTLGRFKTLNTIIPQVIRRLIASGLLRQWDDEKDKRSKHIAITDEGGKLLFQVFEHTNHVG